jgi:archaellum component FlaF (FlaF/FlaG flagellin family)
MPVIFSVAILISGGMLMATKTNYILKVQDAKLADVQKALKDANITVVSIMEIHKEEA